MEPGALKQMMWSPRALKFSSWSPGALHFLGRSPGALNPFGTLIDSNDCAWSCYVFEKHSSVTYYAFALVPLKYAKKLCLFCRLLLSPLECALLPSQGHLFDDLKIGGSSGEESSKGHITKFFLLYFILIYFHRLWTSTIFIFIFNHFERDATENQQYSYLHY